LNIPRNLISDSALIQETFELARGNGGCIGAKEIADSVFRLSDADELLSASLVADLLRHDSRFHISEGSVKIVNADPELTALKEAEFVVLDTEAIVIPSHAPRLIELAAYRLRSGELLDSFQTLVNPGIPVPAFVTVLTGITNEMVANAPSFAEVLNVWLEFADDSILVAHDTAFDLPLLNREIARVYPGYRLRNIDLCTVKLARRLIPGLDGHNLGALADYFGITIAQRHRAAPDALATAQVLKHLLSQLERHGARTIADARTFHLGGKAAASRAALR
jgi:DNA polymerase III epsilon subunit family exonuclease